MASSAATTVPYTDVVTVATAAPTLVYTVLAGSLPNLPCTIAVQNPVGSAHTVYVCNSDDTDTSRGFAIVAGTQIAIDMSAGAKLYMIAATGDTDVRIMRSGSR